MQAMPEQGGQAVVEPEVSRLAMWSFVCGLFFFLLPMGLLAIILAVLARRAIRRSHGQLAGCRIAEAGLWLGMTSIAFACFIVMLPFFTLAREGTRAVTCRSNLKQIGMAIGMYERDHSSSDGYHMPPDLRTLVENGYLDVGFASPGVLQCPQTTASRRAPAGGARLDPDRDGDYVYARLVDPASATGSVPIMWERYRHVCRPLLRWTAKPDSDVNVLFPDLSARSVPYDVFETLVERYRPLYESEPRLPRMPPVPRGWSVGEYALALALGFPFLVAGIAAVRGGAFARWLYARLPDRPRDMEAETARSTDDTDAHVSPAKQDGV